MRTISGPTPWKSFTGEECPHGRQIVVVDGTYVRNHLDSDFCQGGNGYRYKFIPRKEIWIDACVPKNEVGLIVFHECEEAELMARGMSYSRAHDTAKRLEDQIRRSGHEENPAMPRKPKRKKFPKLTKREKELASRFIAEEHKTGKFKPKAAVAVGLSRARRAAAKEKIDAIVAKYA